MTEQKIDALVVNAGTTLKYFTGISWWPSERTMVAIIPARESVKYICRDLKKTDSGNLLR